MTNYRVTSRYSASQDLTNYAIIVVVNDGVFRQEYWLNSEDIEKDPGVEREAVEVFLNKAVKDISSGRMRSKTPGDLLDQRTQEWIDDKGYERREDLEDGS